MAECRLARLDLRASRADYTKLCKAGLTTPQVSDLMNECGGVGSCTC